MFINGSYCGTRLQSLKPKFSENNVTRLFNSFVSVRAFCPQCHLGTLRYCKRQEVENVASIRLLVAVGDLHP